MSLKKSIKIDKIEIVGDFKILQIREATVISENNIELSKSFHRYTLSPDQDVSNQPDDIQGIANVVWTDDIKKNYSDYIYKESNN
mgnify:CR=1 FL=1|tara:strand:- start:61 stop:315 length:255 start_codon:yes stop_codon:yes gene_type:complete